MNIPRPAIENKMRMAGLTEAYFAILDKDPETEYVENDEEGKQWKMCFSR